MRHHDEVTGLASTSLWRALIAFALCWLLIVLFWMPAFAQVLVYVSIVPVAAALAAYRVRLRLIHIPYLMLYLFVAWQAAAMTYADSWASLYATVLSKFNPFNPVRFGWIRFDSDLIAVLVGAAFVLISSLGARLVVRPQILGR